jgi:hypothetical protein
MAEQQAVRMSLGYRNRKICRCVVSHLASYFQLLQQLLILAICPKKTRKTVIPEAKQGHAAASAAWSGHLQFLTARALVLSSRLIQQSGENPNVDVSVALRSGLHSVGRQVGPVSPSRLFLSHWRTADRVAGSASISVPKDNLDARKRRRVSSPVRSRFVAVFSCPLALNKRRSRKDRECSVDFYSCHGREADSFFGKGHAETCMQ